MFLTDRRGECSGTVPKLCTSSAFHEYGALRGCSMAFVFGNSQYDTFCYNAIDNVLIRPRVVENRVLKIGSSRKRISSLSNLIFSQK